MQVHTCFHVPACMNTKLEFFTALQYEDIVPLSPIPPSCRTSYKDLLVNLKTFYPYLFSLELSVLCLTNIKQLPVAMRVTALIAKKASSLCYKRLPRSYFETIGFLSRLYKVICYYEIMLLYKAEYQLPGRCQEKQQKKHLKKKNY